MKTHPGALTNNSSKAHTNDNEAEDDLSSHSTTNNQEKQEGEPGLTKSPQKGDSTEPPPVSVVSSEADEPMDTTV